MTFTTDQVIPAGQEFVFDDCQVTVIAPEQWSAEKPNLYLMSLNLEDNSGSAIESTRSSWALERSSIRRN